MRTQGPAKANIRGLRRAIVAAATAVLVGAGGAFAGAPALCGGAGGGHGAGFAGGGARGGGGAGYCGSRGGGAAFYGNGGRAPALANYYTGQAPALANAALGGYPTQFRGHSRVITTPGWCTPRGSCWNGGWGWNDCSTSCAGGVWSGNIGYRSCSTIWPGWCSAQWCGSGIYPWYFYPYAYVDSTYTGWPLYEVDRRVGPGGEQIVIVVVEPKVDEALEALQDGRFIAARMMYLERAEDRKDDEAAGKETRVDRTALRLAALASAGEGRYPEADRLFGEAYAQDPSLTDRPLDGATLVGGSRAMREIVNGAVAYAHKVGTADAWRMVAWLMQGEGRNDVARAMMARAEAIGDRAQAPAKTLPATPVDEGKFAAVER